MALLDLVQGVCDEVGLPRPSAVAASQDQLARQMFGLAKKELKELSKGNKWPVLTRDYSFPTVAATEAYALPADYCKLVGNTLYNADQFYQLRGSVTAQEWMRTKNLNLGSLSRAKVRVYGSPLMLHIVPTPADVQNVAFEYITDAFAVDSEGTAIATYMADTDTAAISEDLVAMGLKWRIKHAKGLEFGTDLAEYVSAVKREFAAAVSLPAIVIGGKAFVDDPELSQGYIPDTGFGQ
jgi:hypothetical protein